MGGQANSAGCRSFAALTRQPSKGMPNKAVNWRPSVKAEVVTTGFGDAGKLSEALRPGQGGRAQVLAFTATHDRLTVWLTKPATDWIIGESRLGGVLLECVRCVFVRFVPVWGPTDIRASGVARDGSRESLRLADGTSFEVVCWDAQVTGEFADFLSMCHWLDG
jgi:hypothetical protein